MGFNVECWRDGVPAQEANDAIPINSLNGGKAPGPSVAVVFVTVNGVLPADCALCSIQMFPSNKFSVGASGGSIGVTCTFTNTGNDKTFGITGGGTVVLPDGFWGSDIRGLVSAVNFDDCTVDFYIQSLGLDPTDVGDFSGPNLTDTPHSATITAQNYDAGTEEGDVTFQFEYDNADAEDPNAFSIVRSLNGGAIEPVGSIPWVSGQTTYTYTDYIFEPGTYEYFIYAYKYGGGNSVSAPATFSATFGGATPDITMTMTLQADFALESEFVFIGDPSGIYTLVENKRHDTLYERAGSEETINVKIPDPFVKTGFVP